MVIFDGNKTFVGVKIAEDINQTTSCAEPDGGFNPLVASDMNATYADRNGTISYTDYCLDSNTLVEYMCGGNGFVNGAMNPLNSYAIKFKCSDLNKTCSLGKCV